MRAYLFRLNFHAAAAAVDGKLYFANMNITFYLYFRGKHKNEYSQRMKGNGIKIS